MLAIKIYNTLSITNCVKIEHFVANRERNVPRWKSGKHTSIISILIITYFKFESEEESNSELRLNNLSANRERNVPR